MPGWGWLLIGVGLGAVAVFIASIVVFRHYLKQAGF